MNPVCIRKIQPVAFIFERARKRPPNIKAKGKGTKVKLYSCPAVILK